MEAKIIKKLNEKLEVEDSGLIANSIPTRFKYAKVKENDFELTDEMLIYLDDKTLNKFVPVKRIAPYKEEEFKLNKFLLVKEMKNIRKEIERKKDGLKEFLINEEKNIEDNKVMLSKKIKNPNKPEVNIKGVDKNRLQAYNID